MILIAAEESTDTLLIGLASHVRIKVTDYLLAFIYGICAAKE